MVRFDLGPLLQGQTRIANLKSAYNSLINGPRGVVYQPIVNCGLGSFGVVRFDLGPLFQGHTRITKLKSAYNSFIIGPRVLGWQINL